MADTYEVLKDALAQGREIQMFDGTIRVPTTTLFPSGELINVVVTPSRGGGFSISDGGLGRTAVLDEGIHHMRAKDRRRADEIAARSGLRFDGDAFVAEDVDANAVMSAVALVAEASRAWATQMMERAGRRREAALLDVVREKLERAYSSANVKSEMQVLGASSSQYRFDFGVRINDGRFALFEVVSPAPPSVAFAQTKFSDVLRVQPDWPREAIVENLDAWPSDALALVSQVASHVRPARSDWRDLPAIAA